MIPLFTNLPKKCLGTYTLSTAQPVFVGSVRAWKLTPLGWKRRPAGARLRDRCPHRSAPSHGEQCAPPQTRTCDGVLFVTEQKKVFPPPDGPKLETSSGWDPEHCAIYPFGRHFTAPEAKDHKGRPRDVGTHIILTPRTPMLTPYFQETLEGLFSAASTAIFARK